MIFRIPIFLLVGLLPLKLYADEGVRDGDIIFQRSQSGQDRAISAATKSKYTHVGIIFFSEGRPFVYEAVQPVTRTPLEEWTQRGLGEHYVIKRLKDPSKVDFAKVKKEVEGFIGRDYDWLFGWSDDRIYCSELVWKAYKRGAGVELSAPKKLRDFDLSSQAVHDLMKQRYGNDVPLDMDVVAPSDIFESKKLMTVE